MEVANLEGLADILEGITIYIKGQLYQFYFLSLDVMYFEEIQDHVSLAGLNVVAALGEDGDYVLGFQLELLSKFVFLS